MLESNNTVPGAHQLRADEWISAGGAAGRPLILFLGNSITRHGPKPDIGWTGDWGMAASSRESDYVHIIMRRLRETYTEASFRIGQIAQWEQNIRDGRRILAHYQTLLDPKPDVIVCAVVGANCPKNDVAAGLFRTEYGALLDFFNPDGRVPVIVTGSIWQGSAWEQDARHVAAQKGCRYVPLKHIGADEDMLATGHFAHAGVAAHPGDKGMRCMADILLDEIHGALDAKEN